MHSSLSQLQLFPTSTQQHFWLRLIKINFNSFSIVYSTCYFPKNKCNPIHITRRKKSPVLNRNKRRGKSGTAQKVLKLFTGNTGKRVSGAPVIQRAILWLYGSCLLRFCAQEKKTVHSTSHVNAITCSRWRGPIRCFLARTHVAAIHVGLITSNQLISCSFGPFFSAFKMVGLKQLLRTRNVLFSYAWWNI